MPLDARLHPDFIRHAARRTPHARRRCRTPASALACLLSSLVVVGQHHSGLSASQLFPIEELISFLVWQVLATMDDLFSIGPPPAARAHAHAAPDGFTVSLHESDHVQASEIKSSQVARAGE